MKTKEAITINIVCRERSDQNQNLIFQIVSSYFNTVVCQLISMVAAKTMQMI